MGRSRDPRAIKPLLQLLATEGFEDYARVTESLIKIGTPSVLPLIEAFGDRNFPRRVEIVWCLAQIRDTRSSKTLIDALHDERPLVRRFAALGLGKMRSALAISNLAALLDDENKSVREEAEWALVRIGKWAINELLLLYGNAQEDSNLKARIAVVLRKMNVSLT